MSRFHRLRRHAAHSVAMHDRARSLAAERLDTSLTTADRTWLDEHLAACSACRAIATAYETDRLALRALRDRQPEPPRDLWARTAAALEHESAGHGRSARASGASRGRRWPAVGVLSGVAVVAIVVGANLFSGGFQPLPPTADLPTGSPPAVAIASSPASPDATPIAVGAGAVGWIGAGSNGKLAYNQASFEHVCAADRKPDCPAVGDRESKPVTFTVRPRSVFSSPVGDEAIVVGTDPDGEDTVVVVALPNGDPTSTPAPTRAPTPPATPTATPVVTSAPSSPASSEPTETAGPAETPSSSTPTVEPSATPEVTVEPSNPASLAIVSGVRIVGKSAAYSPDGDWFAFTARPSDDSVGPDIYVWRVGQQRAKRLTDDHASVFASWSDGQLIGSRPTVTQTGTSEVSAESFLLDPSNGTETELDGAVWRPIVDPDGRWAITWDGTVNLATDGLSIAPADGALVVRRFDAKVGVGAAGGQGSVVTDGAVAEFDARWDESGRWLAVWLADPSDPSLGRLSLHHLDPGTGKLERLDGAPKDVTALPGFSIGNGRLAWATPPGQGGEGSRVQIVAWSGTSVGAVESGPVEDVVVIH